MSSLFNIFNLGQEVAYGLKRLPQWRQIESGLRRNFDTIINYYRTYPMAVKTDHFLVRLLQSMTVPQHLNLERYYDNVRAEAPALSKALGMTSDINQGRFFTGVFYPSGYKEVIIFQDDLIDLSRVEKDWENMTPVRVLKSPSTNLQLPIPDGSQKEEAPEFATGLMKTGIIMVNIPQLCVMYRSFRLAEVANEAFNDSGSQRSLQQFVRMYVLPNMLQSAADQAIFNRAMYLSKTIYKIPDDKPAHPFFLSDWSNKVDACLEELVYNMSYKHQLDFQGALKQLPAAFSDSQWEAQELPEFAPTRQVLWAMFLSRVLVLSFLFKVNDGNGSVVNSAAVSRIFREINYFRSAKIMENALPEELLKEVNSEIEAWRGHL